MTEQEYDQKREYENKALYEANKSVMIWIAVWAVIIIFICMGYGSDASNWPF